MSPKSIFSDSFEDFFELVKSTSQQTTQAVKMVTVGSLKKALDQFTGVGEKSSVADKGIEKLENGQAKQQNYTPLRLEKLQEKYREQDEAKMNDVRQKLWHYFNLEKQEENKAIEERKRKEIERKHKEEQEKEEEIKRKQAQQQQNVVPMPKGKERRSIFAPRKTARRSMAETRVGTGKQ